MLYLQLHESCYPTAYGGQGPYKGTKVSGGSPLQRFLKPLQATFVSRSCCVRLRRLQRLQRLQRLLAKVFKTLVGETPRKPLYLCKPWFGRVLSAKAGGRRVCWPKAGHTSPKAGLVHQKKMNEAKSSGQLSLSKVVWRRVLSVKVGWRLVYDHAF